MKLLPEIRGFAVSRLRSNKIRHAKVPQIHGITEGQGAALGLRPSQHISSINGRSYAFFQHKRLGAWSSGVRSSRLASKKLGRDTTCSEQSASGVLCLGLEGLPGPQKLQKILARNHPKKPKALLFCILLGFR